MQGFPISYAPLMKKLKDTWRWRSFVFNISLSQGSFAGRAPLSSGSFLCKWADQKGMIFGEEQLLQVTDYSQMAPRPPREALFSSYNSQRKIKTPSGDREFKNSPSLVIGRPCNAVHFHGTGHCL